LAQINGLSMMTDKVILLNHKKDKRSIGRLFISPGAQPRLLELEEPGLIIGTNLLITYTILRELASPPAATSFPKTLARAIARGLVRMRRFHNRGYCEPSELTPVNISWSQNTYILQPKEVWHDQFVPQTDVLLTSRNTTNLPLTSLSRRFLDDQLGGPYEAKFKLDATQLTDGDVFRAIEKTIGGDFVGSGNASRRLASLLWSLNKRKKEWNIKPVPDKLSHTILDDPREYFIDTFVEQEIQHFLVGRQISMRFGSFLIADPYATKPILDLSQRIRQHVFQHRYAPPEKGKILSVALFGTPGSGKSHLAKEIARSIDPMEEIFARKEFNVSQFGGKEQLRQAFADIAGSGLGGKVPLVLWDEFDSVHEAQRGGWLAQFLMPMQDARYFDGREDRWLGTAVFVFIGGTFADAAEFRRWASKEAKDEDSKPPESVILKGRDFHSRLFASLNMPPITYYKDGENGKRQQIIVGADDNNDYKRLARAVFLRESLWTLSKELGRRALEDIEPEMLNFLLNVPLRHGARSLRQILMACLVNAPDVLRRRHLPPKDFLAEHIETTNVLLPDGSVANRIEGVLSALFPDM
jgi:ATPase family associated with various cellular activities (AAA)